MLSKNVIVGFSLTTGTVSEFILSTYNETSYILNICLIVFLGVSIFLFGITAIIFSTSNSGYLFNDEKFYSLLLTATKRTTFDILKYFSSLVLVALDYYIYLIVREKEEVKTWEVVFAGLLMVVVYIFFLWLFTHNNKEIRKIERNTVSNLLQESKTIDKSFPILVFFSTHFFSLSILIAIYGFVFDIVSWIYIGIINIWINLFRVVFVLLAFSFPWLKKLLYKYESNSYVSYGEIIIPITATLRIGNPGNGVKTPTEQKDQTSEELKPGYKENLIIQKKGTIMNQSNSVVNLDNSPRSVQLQNDLERFVSRLPGLPKLPTHILEYEGWFRDTKKHIAMDKEKISIDKYSEVVRSYKTLYSNYLDLVEYFVKAFKIKLDFDLTVRRAELHDLQIEVERAELEERKSEHNFKTAQNLAKIEELKNPKPPQTSIREQKEEELFLAQIQAQIDSIKNRPPKPEITDPVVRKLNKIKEFENKREEMKKEAKTEQEKSRIDRVINNEIASIMEGR